MSSEKLADSQKKLELATSLVVAFINASKPSEKSTKAESAPVGQISEAQILGFLEKTYAKLHDLAPYQDKRMGLGNH